MNPAELHDQMLGLISELDMLHYRMNQQTQEAAENERSYRYAKAHVILETEGSGVVKTATADKECNELMFKAHLSESMKKATSQAIKSKCQQLSALQTLAGAYRAEADFARTGPR